MKTDYSARTLKLLKAQNLNPWGVERWIPGANIRRDLYNIIDIIAISDTQTFGVQSTSWKQRTPHLKKILQEYPEALRNWCQAGRRFLLITFKKEKIKRGGIAFRYTSVIEELDANGKLFPFEHGYTPR